MDSEDSHSLLKSIDYINKACKNLGHISFILEGLNICEFTINPLYELETGWTSSENTTTSYKLILVLSGCLQASMTKECFEVMAGNILFIAPDNLVKLSNFNSKPLFLYIIDVRLVLVKNEKSEVEMVFNTFGNKKYTLIKNCLNFSSICEQILKEAFNKQMGYLIIVKRLILSLIVCISRYITDDNVAASYYNNMFQQSSNKTLKILNYLDNTIEKNITIQDIANNVFMSKRHVIRIVKEILGTTISQFINQNKIQKARKLLRTTNLSIAQIAEKLGYSSIEHFNLLYKKVQNISPNRYRKMRADSEDILLSYTNFDLDKAEVYLGEFNMNVVTDNLIIDFLRFTPIYKNESWKYDGRKHVCVEFDAVEYGGCNITIDGRVLEMNVGEFCAILPGVEHSYLKTGDVDLMMSLFKFEIGLVKKDIISEEYDIMKVFEDIPAISFKSSEDIRKLLYQVYWELDEMKLGLILNIRSYITLITIYLARIINSTITPVKNILEKDMLTEDEDKRIKRIENFIENNIDRHVTANDIAEHMLISLKQVSRLIKFNTGFSIKEYIDSIKIKKAKELLKNRTLSIKSISKMLGFSKEYYFSSFFKRKEGYNPRDFTYESLS